MLALCSWKQEQGEGMGLVTFIVENILKEYEVDQSRVSAIKTGLCQSVNTGEVIYTQVWEEEGSGLENGFRKLYFAASGHMTGKPVVTGSYILIKKRVKIKPMSKT